MAFRKCLPEKLPVDLQEHGKFCLWRAEDGRKIPYNPRTKGKAQPNNPETFSDYRTAVEAGPGYDGMGIGIFGTLAAVDIDHCIIDGKLTPLAEDVIRIMDSYTERSPSGDGVHILFRADGFKFDTSSFYTKNSKIGLEIYIAGMTSRYMTVTGYGISGSRIENRAAAVKEVLEKYMKRQTAEREVSTARRPTEAALSLSDGEVVAKARMAKNGAVFSRLWEGDISGYPSHSEADQSFCNILAFWTGGDEDQIDRIFRQSGLMRDKWELDKYRDRTISAAIDRCTSFYIPPAQMPPKPQEPEQAEQEQRTQEVKSDSMEPVNEQPAIEQSTEQPKKRKSSVELFDQFLEKVQTEAYKPIQTGMQSFDKLLGGGLDPQSLVMIGAAPGMGKTSLVQQIFETMAKNGKQVIFFNFEMSREQLLARSISRAAGRAGTTISAADVMRGYKWTAEQRAAIMAAASEYRQTIAPKMFYNPEGMMPTVEAVKRVLDGALEKAQANGTPAPIIVLDYLQLIQADGKQDAQEAIKAAVKVLKDYAIDGNTVACAILAFNRNSNSAGKVTLESGRDTSAIEYSADTLLGLNYERLEDGTANVSQLDELQKGDGRKERELVLKLLKKRMTEAGSKLYLHFDGARSTFYPVDKKAEENKVFGSVDPSNIPKSYM